MIAMSRAAGGKKFDKMNVARVYFGNWLRDYSQAIDVGTVKYVSAEAIRILLWVLGFMTFGYATGEFEVTAERLGCYRPEDHIDNPKDYADNIDATQYDERLRGPVDESSELAIDEETGMKNYIANENVGIVTSAGHVRSLFTRATEFGRSYANTKDETELYEALRLLGTGLHCLEDWPAHSNYTELALREITGEDIFPHVGRNAEMRLPGSRHRVYPIVTGTFGGVDFLHSVMGEMNDKATQSEIQQLENTMQGQEKNDTSFLKELLGKIPDGIFGGEDEGSKADDLRTNAMTAQMNQTKVSPREPEAWTLQMQECAKQIYPIVEWHDKIMQKISKAINSIPIFPELIEKLEDQINIFVFGLLAPFVLPLITQLKNELNTGSSEIIQSSKDKQFIVFDEDYCTDPTHSMLAKDHFSNILNEPAGKIASATVKWVVPQIMEAWDNESIDIDRVCTRIINGTLHHPALRDQGEDGATEGRQTMFRVVEEWWSNQSGGAQQELLHKLSRDGVQNGENHKDGVEDCGHGCGKPLSMAKNSSGQGAGGGISDLVNALGGGDSASGAGREYGRPDAREHIEDMASKVAGGGALGGIVGSIAGALSGGLLSGAFGDNEKEKRTNDYERNDGGHVEEYSEHAQNQTGYGQARYAETTYPSGEGRTEYNRFEENKDQGRAYGYQERTDTHRIQGGGYETTTQYTSQEGSSARTEGWNHGRRGDGDEYDTDRHTQNYSSQHQYGRDNNDDDDEEGSDEEKRRKKERKRREKQEKREREEREERERQGPSYGGYGGESRQESSYGGGYGGEPRQESSYGGGYGGAPSQESSYGGGYGGEPRQESSYGGGYGGEPRQESSYGGAHGQQPDYGHSQQYGAGAYQQQQQYGGGYSGEQQEYSRHKSNDSNDNDDYNRRRRSGSGERRGW